ncbi:MAG: hypothetical protein ACTHJM_16185 [Marmoricola sp.]
MTQIKSCAAEGSRTVDVIMRMDGLTNLSINHAGFNCGIQIPTAELLAALGAVPKADADAELLKALLRGDGYKARAEAAEAKLERVRALLENADADDLKVRFYNKLQRALAEPKPELPTETGSVIIATFDCVGTVYTKPIRRTANGSWITLDEKQMFARDDFISEWHPAKVVVAA